MADIASFRRNVDAAKAGVIVTTGPEWDNMKLRVRPQNEAFDDALARAKSDLVRQARSEGRLKPREGYEQLPISERQALGNRVCLEQLFVEPVEVTMGGVPVTAAQYRELAQTAEFADLMDAVWAAVEIATSQRRVQVETAKGNSSPPSNDTSNGAALPA
ncbi:hypothetical protein HMPREF9946_02569 [Acetobacteraceae bacterium AT-5844]|nr:hypothetical protein HMPREF9946_02569 [Acetobacteraceae bacterium AT-5844]